jgi:hypothetical protein
VDSAEIAGFWSYTHDDNQSDGDRILRLAELLKSEFALLTGSDLDLFVDRTDLKWGEEWRLRIENALATTTFFIPVVTPRYFKSEECRKELLRFVGHAKALGAEELVLPLLYLDVADLRLEAPSDEAVATVKERQWQDCRSLRLLAEDDPEFRAKVNELARRLIEINDSLPAEPPPAATDSTETGSEPGVEPGHMEHFATAEEALPRWTATLTALPEVMERIGAIAEDFGGRMERSDAEGGNFAKKLRITRQFAEMLRGPADQLHELGQEYAASLVALDPAVLSMLQLIEEDPEQATPQEVHEFFLEVQTLASNARATTQELRQLVGILDQARRMSRELAPPIDTIKQGLRSITDGQAVFDEWETRLRDLDSRTGGSNDTHTLEGSADASGADGPPVAGLGDGVAPREAGGRAP